MSTDTTRLMVEAIRIDGGTQPRVAISETTVAEYAEAMREDSDKFPPVVTFFDGVEYWLADGFHRVHAARRIGLAGIASTVHKGTKRDAVLYSVGVNQAHGLRRTNDDKRKAVMTLLNDSEWRAWSDREIGRRCCVSADMVGAHRKPLSVVERQIDEPRLVQRGGTVYQQNTAHIGRAREPEQSSQSGPDKSRNAVAERRERMRSMAAEGYRSDQIAAALGIAEGTCRDTLRWEGIDVPGDRVTGGHRRIDGNRIVEAMVADAENLTSEVNLIEFAKLDPERVDDWVQSLTKSRNALNAFIRRLSKELGKDVEAA